MRRKKIGRAGSYTVWIIVATIIFVGALIFTIATSKTSETRMAYAGDSSDTVSVDAGADEAEEEPTTYTYTDATYGFSLEIPDTWRQLTKEDTVYFMDQESGASVKITECGYYPSVNNETGDSISEKVIADGKTFVSFNRVGPAHYEAIYQDMGNTTYDYLDEVFWDRSDIVTLQCVVPDADYDDASDDLTTIVTSFVWERDSSIPNGYILYYSSYGAFEVGVPSSWSAGAGEDYIIAQDTELGTTFMAQAAEGSTDLEALTTVDITSMINAGQSNFMLQSFTADGNEAVARARYLSDDTWIYIDMYLVSRGSYTYTLEIEYADGVFSDEDWTVMKGLFREFLSIDEGEGNESEVSETETDQEKEGES